MRLAGFAAMQAEIFDCAMERVGRQGSIDALAFELLRADPGDEVSLEARIAKLGWRAKYTSAAAVKATIAALLKDPRLDSLAAE